MSSFWDDILQGGSDAWDWLTDNPEAVAFGGAGIAQLLGLSDGPAQTPTGYQGGIPNYTLNRELLPHPTPDPNRRPGSAGRRYFTDASYTGGAPMQGVGIPGTTSGSTSGNTSIAVGEPNGSNAADQDGYAPPTQEYAEGGLASISERRPKRSGRYLNGDTDGMSDEVPATIDGEEPALLSDGEFVVPADVVSHLGNGNSDAGAKVLEEMLSRIRKERTGNPEQGREINPEQMIPR